MYRSGWLLAGRYRLVSRLAIGGMGEIWMARDERLNRDVAAKLVRAEYAADPSFRRRLHAEARAAAAVRNPHVVSVYDVGNDMDDSGAPVSFVIMELVAGRSLAEVLADGPLSASATSDVLAQVADALTTAHARGVVHRDIKPANIMRDADGRVTVLDFGIARAADAAALTATGVLLGTARYMSPEQVDGASASPASDVYSLGVVAYHCLVGRPPFDAGSDVATALAHRDQPPPALPSSVPPALAALVSRCLAKDPADRPTADALAGEAAALTLAGPDRTPLPADAVVAVRAQEAVDADAGTAALAAGAGAGIPAWLAGRRVAAAVAAGVAVIAVLTVLGLTNGSSRPAVAATGQTTQLTATTTREAAPPAAQKQRPARSPARHPAHRGAKARHARRSASAHKGRAQHHRAVVLARRFAKRHAAPPAARPHPQPHPQPPHPHRHAAGKQPKGPKHPAHPAHPAHPKPPAADHNG